MLAKPEAVEAMDGVVDNGEIAEMVKLGFHSLSPPATHPAKYVVRLKGRKVEHEVDNVRVETVVDGSHVVSSC